MRLAAYAGASTALAAGVVTYAFVQRTNFYSASVYLAQSNLCLMILTNLILLCVASFMFAFQRLMFGPLRTIEIEQLYDKAWYAITETALAMTIFRDEAGAWFLVMFVALIVGKVWGWIGDGRVEVLEQQPPQNPRLFHIRLSLSLAISLIYDIAIVTYCARTVIQQARPNMMVMFLFEFAALTTTSLSTALRYVISLVATRISEKQVQERLQARKAEVGAERERIIAERQAAAAASTTSGGTNSSQDALEPLPNPDDVDEMDIEVPGWEAKGLWVLTLDLVTDLLKLAILLIFFFILLTFYGLPIHIIRDLFITARSFIKRLSAFIKYRRATRDMNSRYPDATAEEIQGDDTCIICREEMRPWAVTNPAPAPGEALPRQGPSPALNINERSRPKKLPCGHVLHLGCLKSWLERQQMCPTCRRPVVETASSTNQPANNANNGGPAAANGQPQPAGAPGQPQAANQGPQMRQFTFGPLRFAFGQANMQDMANRLHPGQPGEANGPPPGARMYGFEFALPRPGRGRRQATPDQTSTIPAQVSISEQLLRAQLQITQEMQALQANQHELQLINLLNSELERLRRNAANNSTPGSVPAQVPLPTIPSLPHTAFQQHRATTNHIHQGSSIHPSRSHTPTTRFGSTHRAIPGTPTIPSGSTALPDGVTIPPGWTLLPLERMERERSGTGLATVQNSSSIGPAPDNVSSTTPVAVMSTTPQDNVASQNVSVLSPAPTRSVTELLGSQLSGPDQGLHDEIRALAAQQLGHAIQAEALQGNDNDTQGVNTPPVDLPRTYRPPPSDRTPPVPTTYSSPFIEARLAHARAQARAAHNAEQERTQIPPTSEATQVLGQGSSSEPIADNRNVSGPSTDEDNSSKDETSDKGKGKAVSVEDTEDDEAGS